MIIYRVVWDQAERNRGSSMFLHPGDLDAFTSFENLEFRPQRSRESAEFDQIAHVYRNLKWELAKGSKHIKNLRVERAEFTEPFWDSWEPPADHWLYDPLPWEAT